VRDYCSHVATLLLETQIWRAIDQVEIEAHVAHYHANVEFGIGQLHAGNGFRIGQPHAGNEIKPSRDHEVKSSRDQASDTLFLKFLSSP